MLSLCLLCRQYDLAVSLMSVVAEHDITAEMLMEIDVLVQLIESPVFASLRLDVSTQSFITICFLLI